MNRGCQGTCRSVNVTRSLSIIAGVEQNQLQDESVVASAEIHARSGSFFTMRMAANCMPNTIYQSYVCRRMYVFRPCTAYCHHTAWLALFSPDALNGFGSIAMGVVHGSRWASHQCGSVCQRPSGPINQQRTRTIHGTNYRYDLTYV
jgi:hypothetical protein